MSELKLSTEEVPQKFSEWLLSMGCPPETVPSVDKLAEMCKGQYYMVWRSLMEHVEPKDIIKQKRLQVFCKDVQKYQERNAFYKPNSSLVVPDALSLWKRQTELREKLEELETKVMQSRQQCLQLVDKVSSKLSHRNLARGQVENIHCRTRLLQQVAEELHNKKANLVETKLIAEGLCRFDTDNDIESKLNSQIGKCTTTRRQNSRVRSTSLSGNTLHSSIASSNEDHCGENSEEYLSLVKCSGETLWPLLCDRRASLTAALNITKAPEKILQNNRVTPRWILSHTASLTCSLGLEACKNKEHIENTRATLAEEIAQDYLSLSEDACELLVLRCEHACGQARVNTLSAILDDVTGQQGMFATHTDGTCHKNNGKQISIIDKAIENKRDELRRVISSLSMTEMKIHKVRECLINVFNSFHSEAYLAQDKIGGQWNMPQESIPSLRRFYEEKRQKRKNKVDLSIDLDVSDSPSYNETIENGSPKFIDELRIYLNSFNLENNKKIVLESGEKVWVFETLQSLIYRFHTSLQDNNLTAPLICPSVSLDKNFHNIFQLVQKSKELSTALRDMEERQRNDMPVIDISSQKELEELATDKIKKCLNENLYKLQKTVKTLDLGTENLNLWSENQLRKYISRNRTIDGLTYMDYESYYLQNLKY